ncbi:MULTISPECIES: ABC transporter substrate-binding protein [unclassified Halomonas]|uniref:ABC transporter substrate-binding protein n=1 Tax=unclassified Halomonas TaxID=2609666 RepID=UPI0024688B81|nr:MULTISPECIES: ABC transporter substrate-binding protein [unclassified Halomonas]
MSLTKFRYAGLTLLALAATGGTQAAEASERIRIAEQFGIAYLPLQVIQDQELIQKYAEEAGLDVDVEWRRLSGGAAVNDALLSGSIDIASAGVGPLLIAWDRTRGNLDVKAIAALGHAPNFLLTRDPEVQSIEDFGPEDRIALPAVGVSVQARFLQYAAANTFGADEYDVLDRQTLSLPHPDATAALISGGTEITGYFSSIPYQYQALEYEGISKVTDSYEILGGPITPVLVYATDSFRTDNPELYEVFRAALAEASEIIEADRDAAVDIFLRVTGSRLERDFLSGLVNDPQIDFTLVPDNTYSLAEFLYQVGAIEHRPESWQDYFFDEAHAWEGS